MERSAVHPLHEDSTALAAGCTVVISPVPETLFDSVDKQERTGTNTVNGLIGEFSAPFGSYKCSGIDRELGLEGRNAFLESKSINLPLGYEVRAG